MYIYTICSTLKFKDMKIIKVIDSKGNVYDSIRCLCREKKFPKTSFLRNINKRGFYISDGVKYFILNEKETGSDIVKETKPQEVIDEVNFKGGKLFQSLCERYSAKELELLARGEGLKDSKLSYSPIHLYGKHHKIGVISDTHFGSKYTPEEWVINAFETFEKEKCECVLHCGDVTDGLCAGRAKTHIYELSHIGYDAQKMYSISMLSLCKLPMYILSGNHDAWYKDVGADIVRDICDAIPNATYMGNNQADIDIDGVTIRLFHGLDGNSYAISYRLQKLIETFSGGKKPNILLAGHTHKACYLFERNVQAVSIPSLQAQTPWMAGKKIAAHTGFTIIEFDSLNGKICNFQVKLFPFYS
jgi:predicted phosphodiesterase